MNVENFARMLLCILLLNACIKKRIERNHIPTENHHTSNKNEKMKIINLSLGSETSIELQNIPEHTWYYETKPDWVVSMVQEYSSPFKSKGTSNDKQATDTSKSIYKIKTLKKGEVIIRFYAIIAWENDSKPFEEVFYKIVVE